MKLLTFVRAAFWCSVIGLGATAGFDSARAIEIVRAAACVDEATFAIDLALADAYPIDDDHVIEVVVQTVEEPDCQTITLRIGRTASGPFVRTVGDPIAERWQVGEGLADGYGPGDPYYQFRMIVKNGADPFLVGERLAKITVTRTGANGDLATGIEIGTCPIVPVESTTWAAIKALYR
jgi:hypothetical protein